MIVSKLVYFALEVFLLTRQERKLPADIFEHATTKLEYLGEMGASRTHL